MIIRVYCHRSLTDFHYRSHYTTQVKKTLNIVDAISMINKVMENGKFQFRLQFAIFESVSTIGKQMVKYLVLEIIFDFRCKFSVYVKKECKFLLILSSPSIHMKLSRTHLFCCHFTEPRIIHSSVLSLQLACCLKIQVKTRSTRTKSNHISDRQVYSRGRQWLNMRTQT